MAISVRKGVLEPLGRQARRCLGRINGFAASTVLAKVFESSCCFWDMAWQPVLTARQCLEHITEVEASAVLAKLF